ncbi:MAG: ribonuclease HI [Lentisphaeraceae bacterium]|nr:ribonuclease HI [Lentisphaeraceae bacterium]
MKEVTIYTDGACRGNPGPGGYAAVLIYKGKKKTIKGGFRHTTNNRMELLGVIEGLKALKERCIVHIFSDSKYICDAVNKGWINKWKQKNWMRTPNDSVKNTDLFKELDYMLTQHQSKISWVKGHAGNELNDEADVAAVEASKETAKFAIDTEFEKVSGLSFG